MVRLAWPLRLLAVLLGVLFVLGTAQANPEPGLPPVPEGLDRSTPRRAVNAYLAATRAGDFLRAAYVLDLREIPKDRQPAEGPSLARRLRYVLANTVWIDASALSDDPIGSRGDGLFTEDIGSVKHGEAAVPIRLTRVPLADGSAVWVVSAATVRAVPDLYDEYGPGWFGERLPAWAHRARFAQLAVWQWIGLGIMLLVAIPVAFLFSGGVLYVARRLASQTKSRWDDLAVQGSRGPLRGFATLVLFGLLTDALKLPLTVQPRLDKIIETLLIACTTWAIMRIIGAVAEAIAEQLTENQSDFLLATGTRARVAVVQRVVNAVVLLLAAALALTQFDVVRRVGVSLLASAGIAGIALGFAAQKVLGNLLAGLQISIAEPVRIGDRVFIENQFGFVEEIGLTYVIIKTWDERRLVLPITQLAEKPFENWTRTTPRLIGTVVIHADYRVPVDVLRTKFLELVRADPDWDGETADLVVLDTTDRAVILRGIASADATTVFDMRCRLREQLLAFLQELEGGRHLPRTRVDLDEPSGQDEPARVREPATGT